MFTNKYKKKGPQLRKSSISTKIVLSMSMLVIFGILLTSLTNYSKSKTMTLNIMKSDLKHLTTAKKNVLIASVDKELLGVRVRSQDQNLKDLLQADLRGENPENRAILFDKASKVMKTWMLEEGHMLEHIFLVNNQGIIVADSNNTLVSVDMNDRAYVKETLESGEQQTSEVLKSKATGAYTFVLTAPIFEDNKVIGFLGISVYTESLINYLEHDSDSTSYLLVMDHNQNLVYHPNKEKIGQPVETKEIGALAPKMNESNQAIIGELNYGYQSQKKLGLYESIPELNWLVVHTMTENVITDPIIETAKSIFALTLVIMLITIFIAIFISKKISDPIKKVTRLLKETEQLNLAHDEGFDKLIEGTDEISDMCSATLTTRSVLRNLIQEIQIVSHMLVQNTQQLEGFVRIVNENISNNSATTEEISAGMEETAATTQEISATTTDVTSTINDMTMSMNEGSNRASQITSAAHKITYEAETSLEQGKANYTEVKTFIEEALEESAKITHIQLLADSILQITKQTNLLALNASIEAARAGESGRGFAVVADEVSKLAEQSSKTATTIQDMVTQVLDSFEKLKTGTQNALVFMEDEMTQNFKRTLSMGTQYTEDSSYISEIMNALNTRALTLNASIENISHAINEVAITATENAKSTQNISQQTNMILHEIDHIKEMTQKNQSITQKLQTLINQFTIH